MKNIRLVQKPNFANLSVRRVQENMFRLVERRLVASAEWVESPTAAGPRLCRSDRPHWSTATLAVEPRECGNCAFWDKPRLTTSYWSASTLPVQSGHVRRWIFCGQIETNYFFVVLGVPNVSAYTKTQL